MWKVRLPSWSAATPIVWGDRLFLTSPSEPTENLPERGKALPGYYHFRPPGGHTLLLLCLSVKDGSLLWQRELGAGNMTYAKHNMASPSPVTDGEHVWALTGTGLLASFDLEGSEQWRLNIQEMYGQFGLYWGYASSPLLVDDRVVVQVVHGRGTDEPSYLLAIDKITGRTIWKIDRVSDARSESLDAYTTPTVLRYRDRLEVVVSGADYATGHDSETGEEVWRCSGLNPADSVMHRLVASPIPNGNMVFIPTRRRPLLAIKGGGKGDVTNTHILWKSKFGPDVPTPACDGRYLYVLDDRGRMACLDVRDGKNVWPRSARAAQGTYSASLLLADGKLYATSEAGTTTVMAARPEFEILATNEIDDEWVLSSLVVSDGRIYLRGSEHLYCIGEQ